MNYRFRTNFFGKLILQVKVSKKEYGTYDYDIVFYWRDAKIEDITADWTIALLKEK